MSSPTTMMRIERLGASVTPVAFDELVSLFIECVDGGASMGYLAPMSGTDATAFWRKILADVSDGRRILVIARDAPGGRIIGSAQLDLESRPNGRHRAEVQKLMVRPSHRRHGLGTQLMAHLEAAARERGLRLLVLDTSEGRSGARELYERLGYTYAGGIPGWSLDPDGAPAKNAIFYKELYSWPASATSIPRRSPIRS